MNTETYEERRAREESERAQRENVFVLKIEKAFELCGLEVFHHEGREESGDYRTASMKGSSRAAYLGASINRYGHKGRICVGLWYANQITARDVWGWDAKHEEITISEEKDSEKIAADIKRRILPRLAASIEKADALIKSRRDYRHNTEENVRELGGDPKARYGYNETNNMVNFSGGSATVSGDDVTLSLHSVDVATAKKIIEIVKRARG